jgi:putative tryptophan/tyrosine transport system substrate-binding protein
LTLPIRYDASEFLAGWQMHFKRLKRREVITLLGGAAAMWPLRASAQQPAKTFRIAIAHPSASIGEMSESADTLTYPAMFKELRRLGYVEGHNLVVERYSATGQPERYTDLAREAVRLKPDLIIVASTPLVQAFKGVTDSVPIVGAMSDPVAYGIVTSVARPGGNITGISVEAGLEIWAKRLQILREIVPTAAQVGFIGSRVTWGGPQGAAMLTAAKQAGVSLTGPPIESPIQEEGYRRALGVMAQERVDGLIVSDSADNFTFRRLIVDLAEKTRLPTVYPYRTYFDIGGLMAYGSKCRGHVSSGGRLRRPDSQRQETRRATHLSGVQVRAVGQFEGGERARPRSPDLASRPRRRGDRIEAALPRLLTAGLGPKPSGRHGAAMSALGAKAENICSL